jgi:serine/threonine protein kinase
LLLGELLQWDPQRRPTASQVLQHPYFANYQPILREPTPVRQDTVESRGNVISRGLPSGKRRTNSKWSDGSSKLTGQSSKGRWSIKPNAIQAAEFGKKENFLPKLREVPEDSSLYGNSRPIQFPQPSRIINQGVGSDLIDRVGGYNPVKQEEPYLPPISNHGLGARMNNKYPVSMQHNIMRQPQPLNSYNQPKPSILNPPKNLNMNPIGLSNVPNAAILGGGPRLPGRNLQRGFLRSQMLMRVCII